MNAISSLLTLVAILISVLTIVFLIMWWRGVDAIAFPGLGLIVATPIIIVLLLIVEVVIVFLATLGKARGMTA